MKLKWNILCKLYSYIQMEYFVIVSMLHMPILFH